MISTSPEPLKRRTKTGSEMNAPRGNERRKAVSNRVPFDFAQGKFMGVGAFSGAGSPGWHKDKDEQRSADP